MSDEISFSDIAVSVFIAITIAFTAIAMLGLVVGLVGG